MSNIQPIKYQRSVAHFRAWMDRYLATRGNKWDCFQDYTNEIIKYNIFYNSTAQTSTREAWILEPLSNPSKINAPAYKYATILAAEEGIDKTIIEFIDGYFFQHDTSWIRQDGTYYRKRPVRNEKHEPIGKDLDLFASSLRSKLFEDRRAIDLEEPETRNLSDWFDYYQFCQNSRIKITLKDIAGKTSYSYDYIRHEHAKYLISPDVYRTKHRTTQNNTE